MNSIINGEQLSTLEDKGYLLIKHFLSQSDLNPLINELVKLAEAFGSTKEEISSQKNIDELFVNIIKNNQKLKPFLYDRLQLLPQLLRIPSHDKIQTLSRMLLKTDAIGVWPRMQLRFDCANDDQNLIEWHTDYIYNRGTQYSYTFWLPLVSISANMGPIKMISSSHKDEYRFVSSDKGRRHSFTLEPEEIKKLKPIQINQFDAGDLVVFHSKFLHCGVINELEDRARLVCVFRMQNLNKLELLSGEKND